MEVQMTQQELDLALSRLNLNIPENERNDILSAAPYIEKMAALVRKPRSVTDEKAEK